MEVLKTAENLIKSFPLCDRCFGRQFALLASGTDNQARGFALKLILTLEGHRQAIEGKKEGITLLRALSTMGFFQPATETLRKLGQEINSSSKPECYICHGKFELLGKLAHRIIRRLHDYEFETFLVGIMLPADIINREDELRASFGLKWSESIRNEFSREIGKQITEITGKSVDFKRPDVVIMINPFSEEISLQVNSLFIAGRYKKLIRGIPQSKWICRACKGQGCARCNWTGKMYTESVEELIAGPVLELTGGSAAKLHAAGREDIDVRMLGTGRPFIIEVKNPKRRFFDLRQLEELINDRLQNKIQVVNLSFASKNMVRKLKVGDKAEKVYQARVVFDRPVTDDELANLKAKLSNCKIKQLTPKRVQHRRPQKLREKYIYETEVKRLAPDQIKMIIRCQGGLYVKEMITGDGGRTKPSVTELVGAKADCAELDVIEVCTEGK
ncbi:tRNA pseudouridine(54/55) synthase Pus10 [Candidatus Bathyarchaeota archaeon]|nr:tRNA pseudouridine(54/55) synthase Pus10 [Candidatus Bathyarchaeota archaeon]